MSLLKNLLSSSGSRVPVKRADKAIRKEGGWFEMSGNGGSHSRKVCHGDARAPLPRHGKEYPKGTLKSALERVGLLCVALLPPAAFAAYNEISVVEVAQEIVSLLF